MNNKCSGCCANLAADEKICPYCGLVQVENSDQALLDELLNLKRRYEIALAQNNQIAFRELLADEFTNTEMDAGEPNVITKERMLGWDWSDKNFFSYSASSEKLLDRTDKSAVVSCIDVICRHNSVYDNGEQNDYARTRIKYIRSSGRWLIAEIYSTTIDENGNDIT